MSEPLNSNIVNGTAVTKEDPLSASVVLIKSFWQSPGTFTTEESFCTGTLVFERFILTAAHCIHFENLSRTEVHFPLVNKKQGITSDQIILHPEYVNSNGERQRNLLRDLALIRLSNSAPAPYLSLPLIQSLAKVPENLNFRVAGFGLQNGEILKKTQRTLELKQASLVSTDFSTEQSYFEAKQTQQGICFGDSGAPAIVKSQGKNYVIGLATDVMFDPRRTFDSGYDRCLQHSEFLNILFFYDWIEKAVSGF